MQRIECSHSGSLQLGVPLYERESPISRWGPGSTYAHSDAVSLPCQPTTAIRSMVATTIESSPMMRLVNSRAAKARSVLRALAVTILFAGGAVDAATAPVNEQQLLDAGFKVLVATTKVQEEWVRKLPPGKIRPMQRTGKKFFIFPDPPGNRVFVGGPKEYETYVQRHPENRVADAGEAEKAASAYRMKQADAMQKATARDLSDPFLGVSWADLGW